MRLGDLEVPERGLEASHLDLVDDEVGAVERGPAIQRGADAQVGAGGLVDQVRDPLGGVQALGVDVVQRDRRVGQLGELDEVREQDLGEFDAAGADQHDVRHAR